MMFPPAFTLEDGFPIDRDNPPKAGEENKCIGASLKTKGDRRYTHRRRNSILMSLLVRNPFSLFVVLGQ